MVLDAGVKKAQAALDFMSSYGMAIIIIVTAVTAVYSISTSSTHVFSQSCAGNSGFACGPFELNSSGVLNITLQQDIGADITVYGLACTSSINNTGTETLPAYRNVYVTSNTYYYPAGSSPGAGVTINTGSGHQFQIYCYTASQKATRVNESGNDFVGYVWANFSIAGRQSDIIQLIATVEAKYT
ncbi:MAG: hypothetical protein M1321_00535 [Candidatus Marsarchaeota archaeon]|nr:hypothetical protein [Candidatus Marsarchaeota archaeon]